MPGADKATEYNTVAELKTAVEALNRTENSSVYKSYVAGTLPTGFVAGQDNNIVIGWKWNYHTDDAGDVADTAMGNADTLENVKFVLTVTATQVD